MADVALLNPQEDAALAKKLVEAVRAQLKEQENVLLNSVLDPDAYHQNMGALIALRDVVREQEQIYRRALNI